MFSGCAALRVPCGLGTDLASFTTTCNRVCFSLVAGSFPQVQKQKPIPGRCNDFITIPHLGSDQNCYLAILNKHTKLYFRLCTTPIPCHAMPYLSCDRTRYDTIRTTHLCKTSKPHMTCLAYLVHVHLDGMAACQKRNEHYED